MKILYSWILDYLPELRLEDLEKFLNFNGCEISAIVPVNNEKRDTLNGEQEDKLITYIPPYDRGDLSSFLSVIKQISSFFNFSLKKNHHIVTDQAFEIDQINTDTVNQSQIKLQIDDSITNEYNSLELMQINLKSTYRIPSKIIDRIKLLEGENLLTNSFCKNQLGYLMRYISYLTGYPIQLFEIKKDSKIILTTLKEVQENSLKWPLDTDLFKNNIKLHQNLPLLIDENHENIAMVGIDEFDKKLITSHIDPKTQGRSYLLTCLPVKAQVVWQYYFENSLNPSDYSLKFIQSTWKSYSHNIENIRSLILEDLSITNIVKIYSSKQPQEKRKINYSIESLENILGYKLNQQTLKEVFKRINCIVEDNNQAIEIPCYRDDLKSIQDLAKEIDSYYNHLQLSITPLNNQDRILNCKGFDQKEKESDDLLTEKRRNNILLQYFILKIQGYLLYQAFTEVKTSPILEKSIGKNLLKNTLFLKEGGCFLREKISLMQLNILNKNNNNFFETGKVFKKEGEKIRENSEITCLLKKEFKSKTWYKVEKNKTIYDLLVLLNDILRLINIKKKYKIEEIKKEEEKLYSISFNNDQQIGEILENKEFLSFSLNIDELIKHRKDNLNSWKETLEGLFLENTRLIDYKNWRIKVREYDQESYIDTNIFVRNSYEYEKLLEELPLVLKEKIDSFINMDLIDLYREKEFFKITMRIHFKSIEKKNSIIEEKVREALLRAGFKLTSSSL